MIRLIATTAVFLIAATASSQQSSDAAQIETAAAVYSASHLLQGTVAFDPAPTTLQEGARQTRGDAEGKALAAALRAKRVGNKDQFYSCAETSPSSCRVTGADVVVTMNRPEVHGDTAFIMIQTLRPTASARMPVERQETRLRLERRKGVWVVIGPVGGGSIT